VKFLVLQGHDGKLDFSDLSESSYRVYAQRHGYDYHCDHFSERHGKVNGVHPSWKKLPLLEFVLNAGVHTWIFWADTDSVVTFYPRTLVSFITQEIPVENPWLLVSRDWSESSSLWSAGVMLMRTCDESLDFIREAQKHTNYMNSGCWDQSAMHAVCEEKPAMARGIRVLPRRLLQSVPQECSQGVLAPWQPGDFIAHATGMFNDEKRKVLEQYDARAIR